MSKSKAKADFLLDKCEQTSHVQKGPNLRKGKRFVKDKIFDILIMKKQKKLGSILKFLQKYIPV